MSEENAAPEGRPAASNERIGSPSGSRTVASIVNGVPSAAEMCDGAVTIGAWSGPAITRVTWVVTEMAFAAVIVTRYVPFWKAVGTHENTPVFGLWPSWNVAPEGKPSTVRLGRSSPGSGSAA